MLKKNLNLQIPPRLPLKRSVRYDGLKPSTDFILPLTPLTPLTPSPSLYLHSRL